MRVLDIVKTYPPAVSVTLNDGTPSLAAFDPKKPGDLERAIHEAMSASGAPCSSEQAANTAAGLRDCEVFSAIFR